MHSYLFDIGNVILFFDFQIAVGRVAEDCALARAEILPALTPLTEAFERGEMDTAKFVAAASARIGYAGDAETFIAALEDIFTLNEPMAEMIAELHAAGARLCLLSNTNAIHVPFFTSRYPVFDLFEAGVFSHEVGAMKPDDAIYRAAIKTLELDASNTIYIDDLPANVAAGRAHGLQSICYDGRDHSSFLAELAALQALD